MNPAVVSSVRFPSASKRCGAFPIITSGLFTGSPFTKTIT